MDCTFRTDEGKFNFRVAAIIQNGSKVLMARNPNDNLCYSVGGRVKMNETLEQAVIREVFEETGIKVDIDRMGFIHENFFTDSENVKFHEISVFFYIKSNEKLLAVENGHKTEDGPTEEYLEWIDLEKEYDFEIYPKFYFSELKNKSNNIKHIVSIE